MSVCPWEKGLFGKRSGLRSMRKPCATNEALPGKKGSESLSYGRAHHSKQRTLFTPVYLKTISHLGRATSSWRLKPWVSPLADRKWSASAHGWSSAHKRAGRSPDPPELRRANPDKTGGPNPQRRSLRDYCLAGSHVGLGPIRKGVNAAAKRMLRN